MPSTAKLRPKLSYVISQLRSKLRDLGNGADTRLTDGELCLTIANSLSRLYRAEKASVWGFPMGSVASAIDHLSGLADTHSNPTNSQNNGKLRTGNDDTENNEGNYPLPINYEWVSRIANSAFREEETKQQEGTRPGVAEQVTREEIQS